MSEAEFFVLRRKLIHQTKQSLLVQVQAQQQALWSALRHDSVGLGGGSRQKVNGPIETQKKTLRSRLDTLTKEHQELKDVVLVGLADPAQHVTDPCASVSHIFNHRSAFLLPDTGDIVGANDLQR